MALTNFKNGQVLTETELNNIVAEVNGKAPNTKASTTQDGKMSKEDKVKLDGIATNANNYTHPTASGNKHIPAGGSVGQILVWSEDGTAKWGNDKDTTYGVATASANGLMSKEHYSKLETVAQNANNYTHPSNAGNKHIPAGGSAGQILVWGEDGTAKWGADKDTKYTHPTGDGNNHIPAGGASGQILRWSSAGTAVWGNDNNTTYSGATESALGLVKKMPTQADSVASDVQGLVADFNALLAKLKSAGLMS